MKEFTSVIDKKQSSFEQVMTYCEGGGGTVIFAGAGMIHQVLLRLDKSRGYVPYISLPEPVVRIMDDWLDPVFVLNKAEGNAIPLDKYEEFVEFFKINFVDRKI